MHVRAVTAEPLNNWHRHDHLISCAIVVAFNNHRHRRHHYIESVHFFPFFSHSPNATAVTTHFRGFCIHSMNSFETQPSNRHTIRNEQCRSGKKLYTLFHPQTANSLQTFSFSRQIHISGDKIRVTLYTQHILRLMIRLRPWWRSRLHKKFAILSAPRQHSEHESETQKKKKNIFYFNSETEKNKRKMCVLCVLWWGAMSSASPLYCVRN